jgi:hypothetical protein
MRSIAWWRSSMQRIALAVKDLPWRGGRPTRRLATSHSIPVMLLVTAQVLSGCMRQPISQVSQPPREEEGDRCLELFERAWGHIDVMRDLHPSSAQRVTTSEILTSLFGREGEVERRGAYERELANLKAVALSMAEQGCPPADLESRFHVR